ncbi:hypothetical protein HDV00_012002 [Rhizophlyctis rosea]|nr:hypothetical protein HDV00_012002 [Rhizophlyctis rosea]
MAAADGMTPNGSAIQFGEYRRDGGILLRLREGSKAVTDPTLTWKTCGASGIPGYSQKFYHAYEPGSISVFQIRRYEDSDNVSAKYCVTFVENGQGAELHTCNLSQYIARQRFMTGQQTGVGGGSYLVPAADQTTSLANLSTSNKAYFLDYSSDPGYDFIETKFTV